MSKLSDRLAATMRRWHIDERRLDEIAAEASRGPHAESSESGLVATSAELAHLQACRRCRSLLVGFGRTSGVLAEGRNPERSRSCPAWAAHSG
jgi:L-aminopeptidase/D-esterase-like protein